MAESFGRLLQRYRIAAGLSQEDLAELAGVSTNAISVLERGLRIAPHSTTLDLLIAALKLDVDARVEIEEAAKLARAQRIQGQRHELDSNPPDESPLNNLPPQLTSFVDREKEVAEIKELLTSYRLVTLVGAGGAGKTRCAVKIAGNVHSDFDDGVWLADLTAISDPALVSTVIARALKVQEAPNHPLLDTVLAYLKRKRLLLILDNCEHMIEEARRIAAAILHDCPDVRILATSRESLSIVGEHAYRMPSLPVPSPSELLSANEMSQYGAVQLFNDRAFSADSRFTLTLESTPHVIDICRRLDGIPLAIELAAARVTTLSPKQLAQRLDERFRVLTRGDRDALPRHRTMRALIDWSYDLLSDDERRLFRKLSIFSGGFTLETAAAVCSEGEVDEIAVLDLLSSLIDKSLVQVELVGDGTRYRLLESTREYAREKLRSAGEEVAVAHAHARAFLEQAQSAYDETAQRFVWQVQVEPELDNFRAALSWAFGPCGDVLLGQHLAGALRRAWYFFGPAEGRRWLQAAQQSVTVDTPVEVLAMLDLAGAAFGIALGQYNATVTSAKRALARYDELSDPLGTALSQMHLGRAYLFLGKITEGQTLAEQALEALQRLADHQAIVYGLDTLAIARQLTGDMAGARQRFREALAVARAKGADRLVADREIYWAEAEFREGDAAEALRLANEALAVVRQYGGTPHAARAGCNMAAYLIALRRFDEAREAARQAVTAARDAQFSVGLAWTLQHLAAIGALRPGGGAPVTEDRRRAARILGYVDAQLATLGALREYTEKQEYDAMIPALRDALGEDELSRLMAFGSTWSEDQVVAEAMLI